MTNRFQDDGAGVARVVRLAIIGIMYFQQTCNARKRERLPGNLTHDDVYKMMMLHRYQRKSCAQLARQFGITKAEAYDLIARRQVGGCCG